MTVEFPPVVSADRHPSRHHPLPSRPDGHHPFAYGELEVEFDPALDTLWTFMRARDRPSFNPSLLTEFGLWQQDIVEALRSEEMPIRYLVLGSRHPGVFSLGGDLDLFAAKKTPGWREPSTR